MCGRMNVHDHDGVQGFLEDLGLSLHPGRFTPRYNLAPTDPIHTLFADSQLEVAEMRWGLLPRNPKQRGLLINARAETAWHKPSFRDAMRSRRAVLPVNGFYEWLREGADRTPFYITGEHNILPLAGFIRGGPARRNAVLRVDYRGKRRDAPRPRSHAGVFVTRGRAGVAEQR